MSRDDNAVMAIDEAIDLLDDMNNHELINSHYGSLIDSVRHGLTSARDEVMDWGDEVDTHAIDSACDEIDNALASIRRELP